MIMLYEEVYVCGDYVRMCELIAMKGIQIMYRRIKTYLKRVVCGWLNTYYILWYYK
jgi:hypothetical protein